jgi:ATP/maltotriose-dependent transcriptional regulator MalT
MASPVSLGTRGKNSLHVNPSGHSLQLTSPQEASNSILSPLISDSLEYAVLSERIGKPIELNVNACTDFSVELSEVFTGSKAHKQRAILLTIYRKLGAKQSFLINIEQLLAKISLDAKLNGNTMNTKNHHFENIYHKLSLREQQVLLAVSKGMTSKEIASTFFISDNTVKNHRKNIKKKLGFQVSSDYSKFLKWAKDYSSQP